MQMSRWITRAALLLAILFGAMPMNAQGVTTSGISARVLDANGTPRPDARVVAVHQPSGTTYEGRTRADGRASLPNMRVGGPYRVTVTALGSEPAVQDSVYLALGVPANLTFNLRTSAVRLSEVVVTAEGETVFSSDRTGAATSVGREAIQTLPTIQGRIEDFVRLTPQYSGAGFGFSFAGQDNRMNNVTVDGAYFNNSFGLAGQPGDRTNVAPISMDAIEQVQVNIAPYDVRQGNFIGAGVNTVTRSGTNEFTGSIYYSWRDNRRGLHGTQAGSQAVNPGEFNFSKLGVSFGGPILRDKLFFFVNYEDDGLTSPGTTFRSCTVSDPPANCGTGNVTRVQQTDLDALSTFLSSNFGYETGPYEGYDFETPATRYLARLDYNLNARNKLSLRYNQLDSYTDVLLSNSTSLGFGNRRTSTQGLNFANSNYQILEDIQSVVGEWNAMVGSNMSNNMIVGYEYHDESRGYRSSMFPFVDVLNGGSVYTSFGFEPFTPNNELRYNSTQFQNNFSIYGDKHELTFGVSAEKYHSENVFFQGAQSVYVYNSLADFYTDANDFIAQCGTNQANWSTCTRATSPVTLRTFQNAWANVPGQTKPLQPLDVVYAGIYAQDQWRIRDNVKLTFGLRLDRPEFGETGFRNADVAGYTFRDEDGNAVQYQTERLPDPNILISPRFGFNWDINNDKSFQLRGGTGVFTGRPAYVWISNQIGNNGVLTGFERLDNTTARPFHPDQAHYDPPASSLTDPPTPAATYALAVTDENFRFPQLWRSNLAVDRRLPWNITGTAEFLYSRDVNGMYYINANLPAPDGNFSGPDQRPRWITDKCATQVIGGVNQFTGTERDRINCRVTNAIVLKNSNAGNSWNIAASLEKPFGVGTFVKVAYSYGVAKSYVDPGSIASGSWQGNAHSGDPNKPALGFAATSPGHRLFGAAAKRINLFPIGPTTAALFWETRTIGNGSYVVSGDLNGDGGTGNDLIYIPRDASEMNFQQYTASGRTFTVAEQVEAWEAFIEQDEYLRSRRGQYAERNAVFLPMFNRADFSLTQDIERAIGGRRNSLQLRLDFLNFGNLLNHSWGVSQRMVTTSPLVLGTPGVDASNVPVYRLRNIGPNLVTRTFEPTAGTADVYRIQLTVRYNFN